MAFLQRVDDFSFVRSFPEKQADVQLFFLDAKYFNINSHWNKHNEFPFFFYYFSVNKSKVRDRSRG